MTHFIYVLNLTWTYFDAVVKYVLNVCIFENVFYVTDLTCGLRWPYSKRTLGLFQQSFSSIFPPYLCCLVVIWNILNCNRPFATPVHTIILCIFYILLEKK